VDKAELIDYVRQNAVLKDRLDELTTIQSDVKKNLKQGIEELGEADDRGHVVVEINDDISGVSRVMNQKRVSKTLDMDVAETILKERNLYERCVTMVPVLNEDEIMAAFYDGEITEEDIDTMFPPKITWALVIK
jgi:hypothetical protein